MIQAQRGCARKQNRQACCRKCCKQLNKMKHFIGVLPLYMVQEMRGGVKFAGHGIWLGEGDDCNEKAPIPATERHSITRAELATALRELQRKCRGQQPHLVTSASLVYADLTGKCEKWSGHKWVGLRGAAGTR